jgi:hypothetical protein
MKVTTLGIDLAKSIFQLHGVNAHGKVALQKRVTRSKLLATVAQLPPCVIGMEACGSAQYWAREFQQLGHTVKLISPQFVKPYVKGNKNDSRDAEAICEAVSRPHMRFILSSSRSPCKGGAVHICRNSGLTFIFFIVLQRISAIVRERRSARNLPAKAFLPSAEAENTDTSLKKANHSKGWDAKSPTYIPRTRDTVAGLPGERSAIRCASLTIRRREVL